MVVALGLGESDTPGPISLDELWREDFSKVLSNGFDSMYVCDSDGRVCDLEYLVGSNDVGFAPNRLGSIAEWCSGAVKTASSRTCGSRPSSALRPALKIQIWTALIALLLVRLLELRSRLKWHTSRFIALLRRQLFVYRDLFRFLDYPFEGPLILRPDHQPQQPTLFTQVDEPPECQPRLSKKEKLRQKRIIMRVPNPAPA